MKPWIEYPSDAHRLVVAWRAPPMYPDRLRWAVGELLSDGTDASFRYYPEGQFGQLNTDRSKGRARTHKEIIAAGFSGLPAFKFVPGQTQEPFEGALGAFLRRIPPPTREDFADYLELFRVPSSRVLSGVQLLGATEAKLPSDGFSVLDVFDPYASVLDVVMEIEGLHHRPEVRSLLSLGCSLHLRPEPENPYDENAVQFLFEDVLVGYVSRFQAPSVGSWLRRGAVSAEIIRLNGDSAKPRAFAFVKVRQGSHLLAA